MNTLTNPLLSGFYPDPTVCKKGDDYYMVTSSFEYFPGVPIFHSRDFVHWHQIGHALTRKSQVDLTEINPSRGIFASTIRFHEPSNRFYICTTLVGNAPYKDNINFYIWAEDPKGPWSEPIIVKEAEGIDPSLLFDGEKAYYVGNMRPFPDQPACEARYIWAQELDLEHGTLIGERSILLKDGAFHDAVAPEGPHLYHIGNWYYLIIAEGGTDHNHSATIFRSHNALGPYESNPRNPLITHRNLRHDYPINSTGHADLIQLADGSWWAVLLASRPDGGDFRNLGRETFAVPVIWEDEWPVFSPQTGRVEFSYPAPDLTPHLWSQPSACDHFDGPELPLHWNILRTPDHPFYSLTDNPGYLRLSLLPETLSDIASPSFVGRRQQHMDCDISTKFFFQPATPGESAGMTIFYNNLNYYTLLLTMEDSNTTSLTLTCCEKGISTVLKSQPISQNPLFLKAEIRHQKIQFLYRSSSESWISLGEPVSGTMLNKENGGGFTGTYLGMYASSHRHSTTSYTDFQWFEYLPILT